MNPVTVIMPVFNSDEYLREAIDSILAQSFREFEFIILDDKSTDGSEEIIKSYSDQRIKFFQNERNLGVATTLNKGVDLASGKYIMRMDSDDICDTERLKIQFKFMNDNPSVGLCGSWVWHFNSTKRYLLKYPIGDDCIQAFCLFGNPLCHPTISFRRDFLLKKGFHYDERLRAAQDFDLWCRINGHTTIENIAKPLVSWRKNEQGITWKKSGISDEKTKEILEKQLAKLNLVVNRKQLEFHREVGNGSGAKNIVELRLMHSWLCKLVSINDEVAAFSSTGIRKAAAFVWHRSCLNTSGIGLQVLRTYRQSWLKKYYVPDCREQAYFLINSLLKIHREATGRIVK
jgi:glycosyltransferase involved in cell wall biosynthesis